MQCLRSVPLCDGQCIRQPCGAAVRPPCGVGVDDLPRRSTSSAAGRHRPARPASVFRAGDDDHRRPHQPLTERVAAAEHRRHGRLGDLGEVPNCTASCTAGSKWSPDRAELGQPELGQRGGQLVGDRPERTDEIAVRSAPGPGRPGPSAARAARWPSPPSTTELPVAVDPLAVVGVLGGDPLQVGGPLGRLLPRQVELGRGQVRPLSGCAASFGSAGSRLRRGGPRPGSGLVAGSTRRGRDPTGSRTSPVDVGSSRRVVR